MYVFLALLGLGILAATLVDSDSSDSGGGSAEAEDFSDEPDVILDETYREGLELGLLDLVNEGEITQAESQQALDSVNFRTGTINVDTAGGDDVVVAGDGDDTILAGDGDDFVIGGDGDDFIDLGAGNDESGVEDRSVDLEDDIVSFPSLDDSSPLIAATAERMVEGGNDRIFGGTGNDLISDSYGANFVHGNQGDDILSTVDAEDDQSTPDILKGGFGQDVLIFDEGDSVETGRGFDTAILDLSNGVEAGYQVATIEDFGLGKDALVIEADAATLAGPTPVTVRDLDDGSGAEVSIAGQPVLIARGGAGLTLDDIALVVV